MRCAFLPFFLWLSLTSKAQTGEDCANAIPLTLDGICRSYQTSLSTGTALVCTGYSGSSPVTYFSFTTSSTPDKVLLDITAPTAQPCEVALYSSLCGTMYSSGGMCFDDGKGLWSFSSSFSVQANTTYKLRIKTTTAGNITICAKNNTPPNNNCAGAISIGATQFADNNASHGPGSEITSPALGCGFTLENTAFYNFYVANDGVCLVNIGGINCDNGNGNNSKGFQALFFQGDCGSLNHLGCESNSNSAGSSLVQFTTPLLTAGTKVTIAIDGLQGSNCSYNISGINILSVLDAELENFTGWKTNASNILKWTVLNERESVYQIERSENGKEFHPIGRTNSNAYKKEKTDYSFEDQQPVKKSYYRLRQISSNGKVSLSSIILLERGDLPDLEIKLVNPVVGNALDMTLFSEREGHYMYTICNLGGQIISRGQISLNGFTHIKRDLSSLAAGKYFISLRNDQKIISRAFIKMN